MAHTPGGGDERMNKIAAIQVEVLLAEIETLRQDKAALVAALREILDGENDCRRCREERLPDVLAYRDIPKPYKTGPRR